MKSRWQLIYATVSAATLVAILSSQTALYMLVKPLLMISLLFYFTTGSMGYPKWRIPVIFALIFSWLGDVLLLSNDLFLAGLAAFLVAHVLYIVAYHKTGAASGELKPGYHQAGSAWRCSDRNTFPKAWGHDDTGTRLRNGAAGNGVVGT